MFFIHWQIEPSFGIVEQFVVEDLQNVFGVDALESSHPISVVVNDPEEINELFDRISYGKGPITDLVLLRRLSC